MFWLVGEKHEAFLYVPRVSRDAHVRQAQKAFGGHVRNFETVEIFLFQAGENAFERFMGRAFAVSAVSDHFDPTREKEKIPTGFIDETIYGVAIKVFDPAPAGHE